MSRKPRERIESLRRRDAVSESTLWRGMFALPLIGTGYNAWFQSAIVGPAQQGLSSQESQGIEQAIESLQRTHFFSNIVIPGSFQVEQSDASEPNRYRVDRGHIPGVSQHSNPKQPFCSGQPVLPHTSSPVCREIVDPKRLLLIEKTTPEILAWSTLQEISLFSDTHTGRQTDSKRQDMQRLPSLSPRICVPTVSGHTDPPSLSRDLPAPLD